MIVLPIEGTPTFVHSCQHETDELRLHGWIESNPQLAEMLELARRIGRTPPSPAVGGVHGEAV